MRFEVVYSDLDFESESKVIEALRNMEGLISEITRFLGKYKDHNLSGRIMLPLDGYEAEVFDDTVNILEVWYHTDQASEEHAAKVMELSILE